MAGKIHGQITIKFSGTTLVCRKQSGRKKLTGIPTGRKHRAGEMLGSTALEGCETGSGQRLGRKHWGMKLEERWE